MRLAHSIAILVVTPAMICLLIPEASANPAPFEPQGKIVFQSDRDGNNEIYSMNADGTDATRLTYDPAADDNPVLSPDGAKIAFVSHRTGYANIYVMNVDGTHLTRLTSGRLDLNAAWSPALASGRKLAFSTLVGPDLEIAVMNADGTGKHVITNNDALDAQPNWSPDGSKIALIQDYAIVVMNPDGTGQTVLIESPINEWPHWSPAGDQIVFHSIETGNHQVYVMNADGTGITRITNDGAEDVWPVWSPEAKAIAFQSNLDGDAEIYAISSDGNTLTKLTDNPALDDFPSWSL